MKNTLKKERSEFNKLFTKQEMSMEEKNRSENLVNLLLDENSSLAYSDEMRNKLHQQILIIIPLLHNHELSN